MDQSLDALFDLNKCAKVRHVGDNPLHELAQFMLVLDQGPGLRLQALQTEGDPVPFTVQAQYVYFDFIANVHDFFGVPHLPPAHFRQVDQAIGAAQIHECAERTEAAHPAAAYLSFSQLVEQPFAVLLALLTLGCRRRQDQPPLTPVNLHHLDAKGLAHHRGKVLDSLRPRRDRGANPVPATPEQSLEYRQQGLPAPPCYIQ